MVSEHAIARFWSKVDKAGDCWLWTASKRNKGYGAFVWADEGRVIQGRAHRFAWELENGTVPHGMCVLHRCDVPACVRVSHLWIGTKRDNNQDMADKGRRVRAGTHGPGRYPVGERHHGAKLTEAKVIQIHAAHAAGQSLSTIAKELGVGISAVHRVITKRTWSHVKGGHGNGDQST